jgi:hypothetical protein
MQDKKLTQSFHLSDSHKEDDRNQVTNVPKEKPALQNASMSTVSDIDAVLEDYKIESPISEFDEDSPLSEIFDFKENNLSYDKDYPIELNDVKIDIHNYEEDDTQLRSNARGALIPFYAYEDGPYSAVNSINSKQTCTFQMKECNLPAEHTSDNETAMVIHRSVQEACDHNTSPWPLTDQFLEGSKPNDDDIQPLNWEMILNL